MFKFETTSLEQLRSYKGQIALEFFSTDPISNMFRGLVPNILKSFRGTETTVDLPVITPLSRDQKKFLKLLQDIPYTELSELKAYVPEGMRVTYLEYLNILIPVTEYLKTIQGNVLQPYCMFLAQMVSDVKMSTTIDSKKNFYDNLEGYREGTYKVFSGLYDKDSYKAETKVKLVVERNQDWVAVLNKLNEVVENVKSVDLDLIKKSVVEATTYLELFYKTLESDTDKKTSREAASRLAEGAYTVAKELEFFSSTYYRVLALNGSIENTIKHIKDCME